METIYFGYGSNLWLHQMRQRCPTSKYLGIARLKGYKWIIYERGYANIVELSSSEKESSDDKHDYAKEVWGLIYTLEPNDQERLDENEGVPYAYQKEMVDCEFWCCSSSREVVVEDWEDGFGYAGEGKPDIKKKPGKEKMLVYINRHMTEEGTSKEEYVYRMNCGIRDAVKEGVPEEYVEQVLRKWIPEEEDEDAKEVALRQAGRFVDERAV